MAENKIRYPMTKDITFFGKAKAMTCDGRCNKAWGINTRPRVASNTYNPDDFAYKADHELGEAPANPGTYEGGCAKPAQPEDRLNKWCARECERATMHDVGDPRLKKFDQRYYNMTPHYREKKEMKDVDHSRD